METVNIGFGDIVLAGRMVAIVAPTSMSVKRMVQDARDAGRLIDATYKRRTRAVIVTDSGHIVLSALQPETLANRVGGEKEGRLSEHGVRVFVVGLLGEESRNGDAVGIAVLVDIDEIAVAVVVVDG